MYKLHSSSFEIFEKKNFRIISSYVFNDKPRDGGSNNVTSGPFPCQLPFGSLYSCNVVELSSISIPSLVPDVTGVTYFIHCGEKVHDSRTLLNLGGRRGREKKRGVGECRQRNTEDLVTLDPQLRSLQFPFALLTHLRPRYVRTVTDSRITIRFIIKYHSMRSDSGILFSLFLFLSLS